MFHELDDSNPPAFEGSFRQSVRARIKTRRRRSAAFGTAAAVVVLGIGGLYANAARQLNNVERIEVAGTGEVDPGQPLSVLLIGTDGAGTEALAPADEGSSTDHADAMILMRVDPILGTVKLLSIPRDLYVVTPDTPGMRLSQRMATGGVDAVVSDIESLGFEVDHVMVVDFEGFKSLVDTVGGIDLSFATPVRDRMSGLAIEDSGCVQLDGTQALALVRARHLESLESSGWTLDPTSDLGRTDRQRAVLIAAVAQLRRQSPDPFTANQLTSWILDHVTVDANLSTHGLIGLVNSVSKIDPGAVASSSLLVELADSPGGAAVLRPTDGLAGAIQKFEGTSGEEPAAPSTSSPRALLSAGPVAPCSG